MAEENDVNVNAAETDANQGADENQNPESNPDQKIDSSDSGTNVQSEEEKKLTQSEVNKIVGGVKVDAYERGRREAEALIRSTNSANSGGASNSAATEEKISVSKAELNEMIRDQSTLLAKEEGDIHTAKQFQSKIDSGSKKHPDFEKMMGEKGLNIGQLPMSFVRLANSMDNTADVMYELGKNPSKFVNALALSNINPSLARDEFERLSNSVKRNNQALDNAKSAQTNEPLDQVKPSRTGTDDGELKTVSDFKKQPWLRG